MFIYLDNNATTPCSDLVMEGMIPYFQQKYGNAASKTHKMGWMADEAVNIAAERCARLINASRDEIIFTSGATESCNLAIKGVFELFKDYGNHIITCKTEHKAVLDTCAHLEKQGAKITYLDVDKQGRLNTDDLERAIRKETILIALMYANNETGVQHPIKHIGSIAKKHKVLFFADATQALGKQHIDVKADDVDLLAASGHKMYGPKGIGFLYIRSKNPRVKLIAQIDGGGHQNGFRSGTLNVPAAVGMGIAATEALRYPEKENITIMRLRDLLEQELLKIPNSIVNGSTEQRLPQVCNIAFRDIKAEKLVSLLNHEIAFSLGSACTAAEQKASHVLQAMHLPKEVVEGSVRFSLGIYNTEEEILYCSQKVKEAVQLLKTQL